MSELKKCPFCSGNATIQKLSNSTLSFVVCVDCRMRTPTLQDGKTAMRVWNTRTPMDNIVEKLKELKMRYFLTIANTGDDKNDFAYENVGNALDKAINIIKQEINNGLE